MVRKSPGKLDRRLARYALVTGAALASMKPAKASVIATFLPTPVALDSNGESYQLDINIDGTGDYLFTAFGPSASAAGAVTGLTVFIGRNLIAEYGSGRAELYGLSELISALPTGSVPSGYTGTFFYGSSADLVGAFTDSGIFFAGMNFFDRSGNGYYGFVEFESMDIVGYAYESDANTPIRTFDLTPAATPEPGSLALLALGAAGMAALRKRLT